MSKKKEKENINLNVRGSLYNPPLPYFKHAHVVSVQADIQRYLTRCFLATPSLFLTVELGF